MLFRLVPNRHVPHMHALIGAIVSAIAFELMNHLFSYYIKSFATYKLVYGAFASFPVFLLWVYLCWLTILLGAVVAASLSYWRTPTAHQLSPVRQLLAALRVLEIMAAGLQQGKVSSFPELSRSLHLGYDVLDEILEKLADANMVRNTEGNGWLLVRDTGHIRAAELLHLFVLNHGTLPAGDDNDPLRQWVTTSIERLEQRDDLTLQELFARNAA
jgi:membrane protein